MDLPTLQRKVQRRFGDDAHVFIREQDIIDWVNDGQLQLCRETNCLLNEAIVTASAFPWIFTNTFFLKMARVMYGTTPLKYIELETLDSLGLDLTTQTTPLYYYLTRQYVNLFPDPVSTDTTQVTLTYKAMPTSIIRMNDSLTVPTAYHEDLVTFCVARAHERNENYRGVEMAMGEFQNRIAQRIDDVEDKDTSYTTIRDDAWWFYQ